MLEERTNTTAQIAEDDISRVNALERRPASQQGSSVPPSSTGSRGGNQGPFAIDRTVVRVGTRQTVSIDSLEVALRPLLRKAGLQEEDVEVRGSSLEKQFTIRKRKAGHDEAREAVDAIMDARKEAGGRWRLSSRPAARC